MTEEEKIKLIDAVNCKSISVELCLLQHKDFQMEECLTGIDHNMSK